MFDPMGMADEHDELIVCFEGGHDDDQLVRSADGWRVTERIQEPTCSTRQHRVIVRPFEGVCARRSTLIENRWLLCERELT